MKLKWTCESAGSYQAELNMADGVIKLSCSNWLTDGKWQYRIEWAGGQVASGLTDKLAVCKELCEMGAEMYEPHGDGFRKKPGL